MTGTCKPTPSPRSIVSPGDRQFLTNVIGHINKLSAGLSHGAGLDYLSQGAYGRMVRETGQMVQGFLNRSK